MKRFLLTLALALGLSLSAFATSIPITPGFSIGSVSNPVLSGFGGSTTLTNGVEIFSTVGTPQVFNAPGLTLYVYASGALQLYG